ncbi:hypothetical protein DIPPA_65224 [Diplonema papillatum]|nr:hypothetical protein DIPPA_65224 [Diplonema papillatum]
MDLLASASCKSFKANCNDSTCCCNATTLGSPWLKISLYTNRKASPKASKVKWSLSLPPWCSFHWATYSSATFVAVLAPFILINLLR